MCINKLEMVWNNIITESRFIADSEPVLSKFFYTILLRHKSFEDALVYILSIKLSTTDVSVIDVTRILKDVYESDNDIVLTAACDIYSIRMNDPSITRYVTPFLYSKGFHALQAYRITHWLWINNRLELAMYFYNHITTRFNVDIHPAAKIGFGIMLDHATGVVIGETAIVENHVTIMQSVTLGSTGKVTGDRHPKVRRGVLIGAGAIILGNIEIGRGSKVGAGSVVLHSVPPYSTVIGRPAQLIKNNIN